MATHSSTPDWRIPWTEEPGGLQSMGSQKVRQAGRNLAHTHSTAAYRTAGGSKGRRAETREHATAAVQVMANENETAGSYLPAFLPSDTTFLASVETKDLARA